MSALNYLERYYMIPSGNLISKLRTMAGHMGFEPVTLLTLLLE